MELHRDRVVAEAVHLRERHLGARVEPQHLLDVLGRHGLYTAVLARRTADTYVALGHELLRLRGRRDVPLTRVGEPIALAELERSGAELARYLNVPLEGV